MPKQGRPQVPSTSHAERDSSPLKGGVLAGGVSLTLWSAQSFSWPAIPDAFLNQLPVSRRAANLVLLGDAFYRLTQVADAGNSANRRCTGNDPARDSCGVFRLDLCCVCHVLFSVMPRRTGAWWLFRARHAFCVRPTPAALPFGIPPAVKLLATAKVLKTHLEAIGLAQQIGLILVHRLPSRAC